MKHLRLDLRHLRLDLRHYWLRVERYKGRTSIEATSSSGAHEFSIIKCMPILEHIGLLNNDKYVKVVEKFMSVEWREFFMNMLDDRKKGWVDSL